MAKSKTAVKEEPKPVVAEAVPPAQETEANSMEVAEITLGTGEVFGMISTEKFRELPLTAQASALVKVMKLSKWLSKIAIEWEPIVRTKMDFARDNATEINQVRVEGAVVHLGAGKKDMELGVTEIEKFWAEWLELDPATVNLCFEEIHKPVKAEISKIRKQKGEPGSMERKRSDMIERYYNPQPKKLEIKEA